MQQILKKNKKYLIFIFIVILVGILCGFIYYHFLSVETQIQIADTLKNYNNFHYNFIIKHLVIMSLILVLSFFIIGVPLSIIFLFYESLSVGFLINIFLVSFGISGLVYSILFVIINKLLSFVFIICFIQKIINIGRLFIGVFIYKKDEVIIDKLIINFKNSLYIIIFVLIFNIILYFISPYIFDYLSFLLK